MPVTGLSSPVTGGFVVRRPYAGAKTERRKRQDQREYAYDNFVFHIQVVSRAIAA